MREPWVWLVFGIPALTVVAGLITLGIAMQRADSDVAGDYTKQGLGINRRIERDQAAERLHLGVALAIAADRQSISLELTGDPRGFEPGLILKLIHPVHASKDREITLAGTGGGRYRGHLTSPLDSLPRWSVSVETAAWRIGPDRIAPLAGAGR